MEVKKYKNYILPKIVKKYKNHYLVSFDREYDEGHLIVYENKYHISPIPIAPQLLRFGISFSIDQFKLADYKRRKWQRLSGEYALIYCIVNPIDKVPFYIGSTKVELDKRLWQHVRNSCNNRKRLIIKTILDNKKRPLIIPLCKVPAEFQFQEERRWILGAKINLKLTNLL